VIVQLSPTKVFPKKLSIIVFPVRNPANVPLPLLLNAFPANVMKMNVPLNCPSDVIVPERSILVRRLRFVKITVPLNVAPVWLGILRDAEKPKNPSFRGF
jgi:hypothetical protein